MGELLLLHIFLPLHLLVGQVLIILGLAVCTWLLAVTHLL